jgi:hypothetical protein
MCRNTSNRRLPAYAFGGSVADQFWSGSTRVGARPGLRRVSDRPAQRSPDVSNLRSETRRLQRANSARQFGNKLILSRRFDEPSQIENVLRPKVAKIPLKLRGTPIALSSYRALKVSSPENRQRQSPSEAGLSEP